MQIPDGREHRSIQHPAERRSTNHRSTEGIAHPAKRGAAERTHVAEWRAEEGVVERRPGEWRTCEERVVRERRVEVAKEGVEKLEWIGECERTTRASESAAEEGVVGEGIVPECTEWVPAGAPPELGLFCWRGPDTMPVVQLCRLESADVHEAEASIRTFLFSVLFSTSYALFTFQGDVWQSS